MTTVMMMCGHAANSTSEGKPSCVICSGIDPRAHIVDTSPPKMNGRMAKCACGKLKPSNSNGQLAFFEYTGEGSKMATENCKSCSYHKIAHVRKMNGELRNSHPVCDEFEPKGALEFDFYYCGHGGWD